ncbi:MAG TPA: alpha-L-fucosidase, partial [Acidimicrobiia bacterium]|nr:alpha-L-fucosidase [Acidimicrobiia bacterium]
DDRPMGSFADMLAAVPRGDYPAYAEAHVRELIARYRPSVLWNDIAWPAAGKQLWPLFAHYYEQVPDGVVNDRWMPWNALMGATRLGPVQKAINKGAQRSAQRDTGIVPPKPPYFDVRTPEYTTFPDVQRTPWECVRGMDNSFGHNAQSQSGDFLSRDELLWGLADIVAKGGNLLLNVGPRGVDAQIPDEQQTRLGWLAEWPVDALRSTRPWVTYGDGDVRYTARDDTVYLVVRHATASALLTSVRSTPTTQVAALDGTALDWGDTGAGLRVSVPAGEPAVVVLRDVDARS